MMPNGFIISIGDAKCLIKGLNSKLEPDDDGKIAKPLIIGQYAQTNVPKDLWDSWSRVYRDHPILKNNLIFPERDYKSAKAKAKELQGETRTGLEGINQDRPPEKTIIKGK